MDVLRLISELHGLCGEEVPIGQRDRLLARLIDAMILVGIECQDREEYLRVAGALAVLDEANVNFRVVIE